MLLCSRMVKIVLRFYKYRVCDQKKLIYGEIDNVAPEAVALINPD